MAEKEKRSNGVLLTLKDGRKAIESSNRRSIDKFFEAYSDNEFIRCKVVYCKECPVGSQHDIYIRMNEIAMIEELS